MYANIMHEYTVVEASGDVTLEGYKAADINFQVIASDCPFYNRPLYDQIFNPIPQRLLTVLAGKVLCQRPQRRLHRTRRQIGSSVPGQIS